MCTATVVGEDFDNSEHSQKEIQIKRLYDPELEEGAGKRFMVTVA